MSLAVEWAPGPRISWDIQTVTRRRTGRKNPHHWAHGRLCLRGPLHAPVVLIVALSTTHVAEARICCGCMTLSIDRVDVFTFRPTHLHVSADHSVVPQTVVWIEDFGRFSLGDPICYKPRRSLKVHGQRFAIYDALRFENMASKAAQ